MIRKTHKKSRRGCLNCKRRRVKCNEEQPACSSCAVRNFDCVYPSPSLVWMEEGKAKSPSEKDTRQKSHEASPLPRDSPTNVQEDPVYLPSMAPSLNLEGIELVLQWFTATAASVAGNPEALHIVQTVILRQAMEHHFLLHGLLALSSLHLSYSHAGKNAAAEAKYASLATRHHNQGLAEYRSILKDMNQDNYAASIAFSSATVIYAFAQARPLQEGKRKGDILNDLIQIFMLSKGWNNVVGVSKDLKCIPEEHSISKAESAKYTLGSDIEAEFSRLHRLNYVKSQNIAEREVYTTAIDSLKGIFGKQATEEGALDPHIALGWSNTMAKEFIDLLSERRPVAMVITAYFCVVLDRIPELWWLSGWSHELFKDIWRHLEPEYQKEIEWPRGQLGIEISSTDGEATQNSRL